MTKLLEIDRDGFNTHFGKEPFAVRHHLVDHELLTVERVASWPTSCPSRASSTTSATSARSSRAGEARQRPAPGEIARGIETTASGWC